MPGASSFHVLLLSMKGWLIIGLCSWISLATIAQEVEPRLYANLPRGSNAIAIAYAYSSGNVLTDPSLPIVDLKIRANNFAAGYVRTFALAGKLARVQVTLPFMSGTGDLTLKDGSDTTIMRNGFGDMRVRLGINLVGSPAMGLKDFMQYQQKTIVGISFLMAAPTGQYYAEKPVNLGSNRWAFKPEVGVSHRFKHVYAEVYSGVWFYTKNTQFLINKTKEEKPVFSIQGHANYYFSNHVWIGINANWFTGGEISIAYPTR